MASPLLHVLICLLLGLRSVIGCTVFAAGKKATRDGSVMVSHSDDDGPLQDARLIYVPAMDHDSGSKRPIFYTAELFPRYLGDARGPDYKPAIVPAGFNISVPIGFIDQVAHTFGYQSSAYGVLNEHGLAFGESTCGAVFGTCGRGSSIACESGRRVGQALMSIDTLSYIAAERCRTSREAVELMGRLALEHGFYGPPESFEGSGESLVVADPDEAWAFQILADPTGTSAIWAAKRLADTDVTVVANMFTIREVNQSDKENYILSPNIFSIARSHSWWKDGEPFDFTLIYSAGEYSHKYYSGRRMWEGFRRAAPSLNLPDQYEDIRYKAVYPWSVKPDVLVTHHDLMAWHRDYYAGTKFDMAKGLQAGPFGTPERFTTVSSVKGNWERSIALYRTNDVYVQHLRHPKAGLPRGLASVVWYAAGPALYAPFLPIPSSVSRSLGPLLFADPRKFELKSMNWATRKVMDVCQIRWDRMHPLVESAQQQVEKAGEAILARLRDSAADDNSVNEAIESHAELALKTWHDLTSTLLFSFSDNLDIKTMQPLSYSKEWLNRVGYKDGPPDASVEDQCPPKCGSSTIWVSAEVVALWAGRIVLPLTVAYMLSGVPTTVKIVRDKDAKDFSPVPYIVGVCNYAMSAYYSWITREQLGRNSWTNLEINIIGVTLFSAYMFPFFAFGRDRTRVFCQVLFALAVIAGSIYFFEDVVGDPPKLNWNFHFGGDAVPLKSSLCGVLTVILNSILYGSPLVQLQLVVRTKSVEFMPLGMSVLTFVISCIWTTQGVALGNITVLIPNVLGVLLGAAQLTLYAIYCGNTPVPKSNISILQSYDLEDKLLGA